MRRRLVALTVLAGMAAAAFAGLSLAGRSSTNPVKQVTIGLKEFKFVGVPASFTPGASQLHFTNRGKFPHNFTVIYAAQGRKFKTETLEPGESQDLTLNLKPGSYVAVCTIFNGFHASKGMVVHFTVGKINLKTGKWGP